MIENQSNFSVTHRKHKGDDTREHRILWARFIRLCRAHDKDWAKKMMALYHFGAEILPHSVDDFRISWDKWASDSSISYEEMRSNIVAPQGSAVVHMLGQLDPDNSLRKSMLGNVREKEVTEAYEFPFGFSQANRAMNDLLKGHDGIDAALESAGFTTLYEFGVKDGNNISVIVWMIQGNFKGEWTDHGEILQYSYKYFVEVGGDEGAEFVFVPDFPKLLALLNMLTPLVQMSIQTQSYDDAVRQSLWEQSQRE